MLMKRNIQVKWLTVLSGLTLLLLPINAWAAAPVKPGVKRCEQLQAQLTASIASNHDTVSPRLKSLEAEARKFCSLGKTAQGNRAYVKALTSLGIKPNLDSE